MILSFPEIPPEQVGFYVGIVASAFALAQLSTNFLWGYLSDQIGRKPVLVLGTSLLAACFALFGFCKTYWQVVVVHVAMGLLNGNAAVVPTALGDLTDRSNQSIAFTWLPIIYSVGSISGPVLGGLLVGVMGDEYPFLAPNLISTVILVATAFILGIWLEESFQDRSGFHFDFSALRKRFQQRREQSNSSSPWTWFAPPNKIRVEARNLLSSSADRPDDGGEDRHDADDHDSQRDEVEESMQYLSWSDTFREIFNRSTISLLVSYLIYQFSNISFNALYPIFAAAPAPTGRDLDPATIGVTLSVSGIVTIVFQLLLFQPIKARLGNLGLYRVALLGLAVSMGLIPWTGHINSDPPFHFGTGRQWLYAELGGVLIIKTISAVGGLSCVMLLVSSTHPTPNSPNS